MDCQIIYCQIPAVYPVLRMGFNCMLFCMVENNALQQELNSIRVRRMNGVGILGGLEALSRNLNPNGF